MGHRFLSFQEIGKTLENATVGYDTNEQPIIGYKYTSYFGMTCWQDPNTPPPPVDKTTTDVPPPPPTDCAEAELAYSIKKNAEGCDEAYYICLKELWPEYKTVVIRDDNSPLGKVLEAHTD